MDRMKKLDVSTLTPIIVLIVLCVGMAFLSPVFMTSYNLVNILQQITVNGVIALGMTVVIFTGGVDLSVGSVLAVTGIVMGKMMVEQGVHPAIAVIVGLLIGAVFGTLNGILVAKCNLQPMIATLGTMQIARGMALTMGNGQTITGFSKGFRWIGSGELFGTIIPVQIVFMLLLYIGIFYLMKYRKSGRYIYSIGGNEEATRLSGINVVKYKTLAYTISGILSSMAAIVLVSKLNSAQSIAGQGYEMDAIASAVIGGASLLGGSGNVWGTLVGAIIIGVIRNGLNLMNVSSYMQQLILGVIILVAVLFDAFRNRKK